MVSPDAAAPRRWASRTRRSSRRRAHLRPSLSSAPSAGQQLSSGIAPAVSARRHRAAAAAATALGSAAFGQYVSSYTGCPRRRGTTGQTGRRRGARRCGRATSSPAHRPARPPPRRLAAAAGSSGGGGGSSGGGRTPFRRRASPRRRRQSPWAGESPRWPPAATDEAARRRRRRARRRLTTAAAGGAFRQARGGGMDERTGGQKVHGRSV